MESNHFRSDTSTGNLRLYLFIMLSIPLLSNCGGGGSSSSPSGGGAPSDNTAPSVVLSTPSKNARGVSPSVIIRIVLDEPPNPNTLTAESFKLMEGSTSVPGKISTVETTIEFTPNQPLSYSSTYTVSLSQEIEDLAGNALSAPFISTFSTPPSPIFHSFGAPGMDDDASAVASDRDGNIYLIGSTESDLEGSGNAGETDLFVTKFSPSGDLLWIRQMGSIRDDFGNGIAVDRNGDIYAVGSTFGQFDGHLNAGMNSSCNGTGAISPECSDIIVIKFDSNGTKLWSRQYGTGVADSASAVVVDSQGDFYITGITDGDLDGNKNFIIPPEVSHIRGANDIFLTKFNSDGDKQWTRQLGTKMNDIPYAIAADPDGAIYITGNSYEGLDGNPPRTDPDLPDTRMFLAKYNFLGEKQWVSLFTAGAIGLPQAASLGVTVDSSGNAYVSGFTSGYFNQNVKTSPTGATDLFLLKYDPSGVRQWERQFGTPGLDGSYALTIDSQDRIYVGGITERAFEGGIHAGGECFHGFVGPCWDLLLVQYDTSGNRQWSWQSGTATDDQLFGLAVDPLGRVSIAGMTSITAVGTNQAQVLLVIYDAS